MNELWRDFLDSWELFADSDVTGLLAATLLALVGVLVVARRQVFLGVAVAQASTLGIAASSALGFVAAAEAHHGTHGVPLVFGCACAVLASLLTIGVVGRRGAPEAVGAWLFLAGSSGSVLLLAQSPRGLEEVQRLMFSSLIGADAHDLWLFGGALMLTVAVLAWRRDRLLLVATDPDTAQALGLAVGTWRITVAIWIGLVVGSAMHSVGTLFTFGELVLPALTARAVCRTMRATLVAAPVIALLSTLAAFVLANGWDLPPAQAAVGLQALLLALSAVVARARW